MSAGEGAPLAALRGATVGYAGAVILSGVELAVRRGDFLALVGPNGGGKTTVVRSLLGALPLLAGRRETPGPVRVGYVPQRDAVDTFWPLSVADVAIMGRTPLLRPGRRAGTADREAVGRALAQVGIAELAARPFGELSGGQRQRTLIARALAADPELLVVDEPTNGMDPAAELETMDVLRALHGRGRLAIVMVTHRLDTVANSARALAFVDKDKALFRVGALEEMLTPEALGALYGRPVAVREAEGRRWVYPLAREEGAGR